VTAVHAAVVGRSFRDRWVSALVAPGALVAVALAAFVVYADLEAEAIALFSHVPEAMTAMVGATVEQGIAGFLLGEVFNLLAPFVLLGVAVGAGANAIAGEEASGTADVLLSHPVGRRQVLASKLLVVVLHVTVMGVVLLGGVLAAAAVSGLSVDAGNVAAATVHLWALVLAFAMAAAAIGAATGRGGLATSTTVSVAVVSYLAATVLPLVEGLEGIGRLSPFHLYLGGSPLTEGLQVGHVALLLLAAAAGAAVALVTVDRRDLEG
jgi:ABC-2 type transport system permease protein